jgi:hypothetical protein
MNKLYAMTKTHVLMTVVMLQLDADLFLNKLETQMHAQLELVMQSKESLTLQETVMMETNALSTIAMLIKDANLFQRWFLKTVELNLQDVTEMLFA